MEEHPKKDLGGGEPSVEKPKTAGSVPPSSNVFSYCSSIIYSDSDGEEHVLVLDKTIASTYRRSTGQGGNKVCSSTNASADVRESDFGVPSKDHHEEARKESAPVVPLPSPPKKEGERASAKVPSTSGTLSPSSSSSSPPTSTPAASVPGSKVKKLVPDDKGLTPQEEDKDGDWDHLHEKSIPVAFKMEALRFR